MIFLAILFGSFFVVYFTLIFIGRKYKNPYTLTLIIGKPGSGKTTLLNKLAIKEAKKGWNIYTTDPELYGGTYVDALELPNYEFKENSVLFIDEVGVLFSNRDFKRFGKSMTAFFKYHRHKKLKIICASQNYDCDKKIRDLADYIYIIESRFNMFSYGKRVLRKLTLTEAYGSQPGCISENLVFDSILSKGGRILTYIPKYSKYFNSFSDYEE